MKDHAPSTDRNRDEILPVLRRYLPDAGTVLEIASGTGQHAVYFAARLPNLRWQPTDRTPETLASITAWIEESGVDNVLPPLHLDVSEPVWPVAAADGVVCINMLHISPWTSCAGLFEGAQRTLPSGGRLFYYGAFFREDRETAPSNLEFDASLRERDPRWGVRQLEAVTAVAEASGMPIEEVLDMPFHNFALIARKP